MMRLKARLAKLETERRPITTNFDLSNLSDHELRLIASVPFDRDGRADLTDMSSAALGQLEWVRSKLEAATELNAAASTGC